MALTNTNAYGGQGGGYRPPVTPQTFSQMNQGGGVITLESWDEILVHLKTLLAENEKLRRQLKESNDSMNTKMREMDGIKAHGMKLAGEVDDLRKSQNLSTNDSKIQQLEEEVKRLRVQESDSTKDLNKQIFDKQQIINKLQEELSRQKMQYEDQIKTLEDQRSAAPVPKPRTVQTNPPRLAQLEQEREGHMSHIHHLSDQVQQLSQALERERMNRNASESQWAQKQNEISELKKNIVELNYQLTNLNDEVNHYKRENSELKHKEVSYNAGMGQQMVDMERRLSQLQTEYDLLKVKSKNEKESLEREKYSLKQQIQQLQQQQPMAEPASMATAGGGPGMRVKMNRLLKEVDEMNKKITTLTHELSEKDVLLSHIEASKQEEIKIIMAQRDKDADNFERQRKEYQEVKEQYEMLKQERDSYQHQLQRAEGYQEKCGQQEIEIATHIETNSNLQSQLVNEQERCHSIEVQLSKSQSELEQVQVELTQVKSELSNRGAAMNEADTFAEEVSQELARINKELETWKGKCGQLLTEKQSLIQENERVKQEKVHWQRKLEETQIKSKEYLDQAQIWKEQVESAQADYNLERKVREKEAQAVKALRQNRDSLQKEVDELRKRVTNQQAQLAHYEQSSDPYGEEPDVAKQYSGDRRGPMESPHSGERQRRPEDRPWSGDRRQPEDRPWSGDRRQPEDRPWSGDRRQPGGYGAYREEEQRHYNRPQGFDRPQYTNSPGYGGYGDPQPDQYRYNPPLQSQTTQQPLRPHSPIISKPRSEMKGYFPPPDPLPMDVSTTQDQPQLQNLPRTVFRNDLDFSGGVRGDSDRGRNNFDITLPGEINNQTKPTIACPLCGRQDFKTQTELEVHAAKCD